LDEFDRLLLETIDEVLRSVFGDRGTQRIYDYLERRSCPQMEIPLKLEVFSQEMRNILFDETRHARFSYGISAQGRAAILEKSIAKILCYKMGVSFNETGPINFAFFMRKLKEVYLHKRKGM